MISKLVSDCCPVTKWPLLAKCAPWLKPQVTVKTATKWNIRFAKCFRSKSKCIMSSTVESLREMRIVTHDCVKLCVWFLVAGPSPGFSSRGSKTRRGQTPEGGVTFFKFNFGCMQQPGGQTWNGGTDFKWGAGHHCTPTGDDPALRTWLFWWLEF